MESELLTIFERGATFYLSGMIAAALFFGMAAIRDLRLEKMEGILFLALSVFFMAAHFFYLYNIPDSTPVGSIRNLTIFWDWLSNVMAPALITLFLVLGLFSFARTNPQTGMVKLFFGLTLLFFLYRLGATWPLDVKGILTAVWCLIWFDVELETAVA